MCAEVVGEFLRGRGVRDKGGHIAQVAEGNDGIAAELGAVRHQEGTGALLAQDLAKRMCRNAALDFRLQEGGVGHTGFYGYAGRAHKRLGELELGNGL